MSTSDSVDRVFSHALATVRRLPRTGSSRPPPSARLRLYGLYKQSMEGDVEQILPRPTLPPPSPTQPLETQAQNGNGNGNNNGQDSTKNSNALHRYGSRDLRTREAQAEIEKWDAWYACAGMTRTAAKKAYISTLIDTMKEYASGTQESRELVSELEFVWGQISRSASGGSGSEGSSSSHERRRQASNNNSQEAAAEQDSPRRSGIRQLDSFTSLPPGRRKQLRASSGEDDNGRMRVLSPVGQSSSGANSIVENEEIIDPDSPRSHQRQHQTHQLPHLHPVSTRGTGGDGNDDGDPWRQSIESHLRHLSTEIAALREQLSSQHLLSSSGYSPYVYQNLTFKWRIWYRFTTWVRWAAWMAIRQALLQVVLVGVAILHGRWYGDRRVETWVRASLKEGWGRIRGLGLRFRWERPRLLGL